MFQKPSKRFPRKKKSEICIIVPWGPFKMENSDLSILSARGEISITNRGGFGERKTADLKMADF